MDANRAAVAANQAYRAGDLDRARQLIDQAAALNPSRAGLWQQYREQIAARRLILEARSAHAAGDHQKADKLLGDASQLDSDGDLDASLLARPASRGPVREASTSSSRQPSTANRLAAQVDVARATAGNPCASRPGPTVTIVAIVTSSQPSTATVVTSGGGQPIVIGAALRRGASRAATLFMNRDAGRRH